jgi:hypothetical protein
MKTYRIDEVFQDIKGDDKHVLMNIPPEVIKDMGWEPGDTLNIKAIDGVIKITKVDNG